MHTDPVANIFGQGEKALTVTVLERLRRTFPDLEYEPSYGGYIGFRFRRGATIYVPAGNHDQFNMIEASVISGKFPNGEALAEYLRNNAQPYPQKTPEYRLGPEHIGRVIAIIQHGLV